MAFTKQIIWNGTDKFSLNGNIYSIRFAFLQYNKHTLTNVAI
jgi:hypothetical protein